MLVIHITSAVDVFKCIDWGSGLLALEQQSSMAGMFE